MEAPSPKRHVGVLCRSLIVFKIKEEVARRISDFSKFSRSTSLSGKKNTVLAEFEGVLSRSNFRSSKDIFEPAFEGSSPENMAAATDLLLTEYLLNFEDENDNECSFATEGFSSGIECSDDEDECSLASIKETIKTSPKKAPVKQDTEKPTAEKRRRSRKLAHEKTPEAREKDRLRSWEYRQRKSKKVKTTEEECRQLQENNKALNEKNIELDKKVSNLEEQIQYLENVIANESALSSVLGAIAKNSGIPFNNNPVLPMNLLKRKRVDSVNDENEPQVKKPQSSGGVCLHLKPGGMSLEFCRECDLSASVE